MTGKIINNKYVRKGKVKEVRLSNSKEFYIWTFTVGENEHVGFSPSAIYYGGKTHCWYSLLVGYFLPPSYNIDFSTVIGKECYVVLNSKGIVTSLVPIITKKEEKITTPENNNNKENKKEEELFE